MIGKSIQIICNSFVFFNLFCLVTPLIGHFSVWRQPPMKNRPNFFEMQLTAVSISPHRGNLVRTNCSRGKQSVFVSLLKTHFLCFGK